MNHCCSVRGFWNVLTNVIQQIISVDFFFCSSSNFFFFYFYPYCAYLEGHFYFSYDSEC